MLVFVVLSVFCESFMGWWSVWSFAGLVGEFCRSCGSFSGTKILIIFRSRKPFREKVPEKCRFLIFHKRECASASHPICHIIRQFHHSQRKETRAQILQSHYLIITLSYYCTIAQLTFHPPGGVATSQRSNVATSQHLCYCTSQRRNLATSQPRNICVFPFQGDGQGERKMKLNFIYYILYII